MSIVDEYKPSPKVIARFLHDPSDLRLISLGVSPTGKEPTTWLPTLRDTVNGQLVLWARYDGRVPLQRRQSVWVRVEGERAKKLRRGLVRIEA